MTPQEAIKIIEVAKAECEWNAPLDYQAALDMAISALEKQIPEKTGMPELGISKHHPIIIPCGNCGMELTDRMWNYCPWCGQAVRWRNDD